VKPFDGGIFLPLFGTLMPSPTNTSRPLTRSGSGNSRSTTCAHSADSSSSSTPVL